MQLDTDISPVGSINFVILDILYSLFYSRVLLNLFVDFLNLLLQVFSEIVCRNCFFVSRQFLQLALFPTHIYIQSLVYILQSLAAGIVRIQKWMKIVRKHPLLDNICTILNYHPNMNENDMFSIQTQISLDIGCGNDFTSAKLMWKFGQTLPSAEWGETWLF